MKPENVWPLAIIAWFVAAICSLTAFAFWSRHHAVDLVAADYYEQELEYQSHIDRESRARRLDAAPSIHYNAETDRLVMAFADREGVTGSVTLYRPADASLDARHELKLSDDGACILDTASMAPGLWRVKLSWRARGAEYYTESAIVIQ